MAMMNFARAVRIDVYNVGFSGYVYPSSSMGKLKENVVNGYIAVSLIKGTEMPKVSQEGNKFVYTWDKVFWEKARLNKLKSGIPLLVDSSIIEKTSFILKMVRVVFIDRQCSIKKGNKGFNLEPTLCIEVEFNPPIAPQIMLLREFGQAFNKNVNKLFGQLTIPFLVGAKGVKPDQANSTSPGVNYGSGQWGNFNGDYFPSPKSPATFSDPNTGATNENSIHVFEGNQYVWEDLVKKLLLTYR